VGWDEGEGEHPHLHPVKSPTGGPPEATFNRAGPLPCPLVPCSGRRASRERDFFDFLRNLNEIWFDLKKGQHLVQHLAVLGRDAYK